MRASDLIELDWEVGVFRAVRALWRKVAPSPPAPDPECAVTLEQLAPRLLPLAQLVAGEAVRLLPARTEGGVRGRDLLVPAQIDLLPTRAENTALYVMRVVLAAGIRQVTRDRSLPPDALRASLEAVQEGVRLLRSEWPEFGPSWEASCAQVLAARTGPDSGLEALRRRLLRGESLEGTAWPIRAEGEPVVLWGRLIPAELEGIGADPATDPQLPDGTERKAPAVEELRRILLDPKAQEDHVIYHTFEKVETADSFDGNTKSADGADDLDAHLEALEKVDLRDLVRDGQAANSVYKAELDLDADVPDVERIAPGEHGIPYDEWDYRTTSYRKSWCTVYPSAVGASRPEWVQGALGRHRRLITRLQAQLATHRSALRPLNRQLDGEEPDLDALVDRHADRRAGVDPSARLYVRQARLRRRFASTVLLDVSLSSDGWVDDRRVLDVSRDAVLVLGEVAHHLGDSFQILAFASSTRNRCRVWSIKGFGEDWPAVRGRLGAIEPQGYTRIGTALRYGTSQLLRAPADRRLLLLVTDGKPNDYDRYEGRYGIADVRMALTEAERARVVVHALAVDRQAKGWLPSMFGAGRWRVLPTPDHLGPALTEAYGRLTHR